MISISIIIPVYNEDRNIIKTIQSLNDHIHVKYEIICIYDSDQDKTLPVIKELMQLYKTCVSLAMPPLYGGKGLIITNFIHLYDSHYLYLCIYCNKQSIHQ